MQSYIDAFNMHIKLNSCTMHLDRLHAAAKIEKKEILNHFTISAILSWWCDDKMRLNFCRIIINHVLLKAFEKFIMQNEWQLHVHVHQIVYKSENGINLSLFSSPILDINTENWKWNFINSSDSMTTSLNDCISTPTIHTMCVYVCLLGKIFLRKQFPLLHFCLNLLRKFFILFFCFRSYFFGSPQTKRI